jgi:hypothetical protein
VHRLSAIALLLACGCATPPPAGQSDLDGAREAMARAFPKDANLYELATIDEIGAPARKVARFERRAPQAGGPAVTRTLVAFCDTSERGWQCVGPWEGARVSMGGAVYSVLAPAELPDAPLLALFSYVGSPCSAEEAEKIGVQWSRAQIRSVEGDGKTYAVQMIGPKGFHLLKIEPRAGGGCAFEIREASALTEVAP